MGRLFQAEHLLGIDESKRGTKRVGEEVPGREEGRPHLHGVGSREAHPPESEGEKAMTAVEIHIDIPESTRGWKKFMNNPAAYFCQKLKRKQVEVCERNLTKEEGQEYDSAKDKEVRNFVAAECSNTWQGRGLQENKITGTRWLPTWKHDEKYQTKDGKHAKAHPSSSGTRTPTTMSGSFNSVLGKNSG